MGAEGGDLPHARAALQWSSLMVWPKHARGSPLWCKGTRLKAGVPHCRSERAHCALQSAPGVQTELHAAPHAACCRDGQVRLAAYKELLPAVLRASGRVVRGSESVLHTKAVGEICVRFAGGAARSWAGGRGAGGLAIHKQRQRSRCLAPASWSSLHSALPRGRPPPCVPLSASLLPCLLLLELKRLG